MNVYVNKHLEFCGVHNPTRKRGDMKCHTGRVYRCSKTKKQLHKVVHIFETDKKVIHNDQPSRQRQTTDNIQQPEIRQMESETKPYAKLLQNDEPQSSPTIIDKTPKSQMPSPTIMNKTPVSQMPPLTRRTVQKLKHKPLIPPTQPQIFPIQT